MKLPFYYPHFVVWELTLRCNLACLHCGSYAGREREGELTDSQALDLCDQMLKLGTKKVTLSGGEPFLHNSWYDIARRLSDGGAEVYFVTNGFFIKENIEKLKTLNIGQIAISVDGNEEIHNKIRGNPDSFRMVMDAFDRLRDAGISRGAITAVSRWNLDRLDEICTILKEREVDNWQLQIVFGGGRMREYGDYIISPEQVEELSRFIAEKRLTGDRIRVFPANDVGYYTSWGPYLRRQPWSGCQAGIFALGLESNGNVKGCLSILPEIREDGVNPFVEGNVKEASLESIWNDPEKFAYNRNFDEDAVQGFCRECGHLQLCRCGCAGIAYYSSGSRYCNDYCLHRVVVARERASSS